MGEKRKAVRVWLLGGFRVSVGSRTITQDEWRLKKAAALVKLLALAPGSRLHREQAMDLLWPDSGRKAASNSLRSALHAARKALDPEAGSLYLAREVESLVLCPEGNLWVDVDAFEEAASTALRSQDPAAYWTAIELYTGQLLPEERYEEWADELRRELRETYASLFLGLAWAYEERADYGSAIAMLRKITRENPTNEEAHVGLMRLHALSGRKAEALRHYESFEETTLRELGAEPSASTRALKEEISSGRFPPQEVPLLGSPSREAEEPPRHNLPVPRTSFVDRQRELTEIKRTLAMTRLLTLTGAGGSGKTRLALTAARNLAGAHPDGAWFAELAALSEPDLVPQAVADAVGAREQPGRPIAETVTEHLREKGGLLVLDNCEHLVDAAAHLVDSLLSSCPHLRVLTTSREPLGIEGEVLFSVPPLPVPAGLPADSGKVGGNDSVRLFVERARLRLPDFLLTKENARSVVAVCRRLDGLPLAIELAAARMGTLATDQMAENLEHSLGLLSAGPRTVPSKQRTMTAAIGWSYGLLSEGEKATFRQLSVFAGGFTLEAAEAVCPGGGIEDREVLNLTSDLVNKSLVVAETTAEGRVRYRMLEPVRQYARERLEESGEVDATLRRHAVFFLALAERAEPELKGAGQEAWLERLEAEHDNFRAALSWSLERGKAELELRLSTALVGFWDMRGHLNEGRRWLEAALLRGDTLSVARVRTLAKASWIAREQSDLERAIALSEEGLALARKLGDEEGAAATLLSLGIAVLLGGELERATALLEEGLPLFRKLGDKWSLARSLSCLGLAAMFRGDYERAKALMEESLAVSWETGDVWASSMGLNQLALVTLRQRDYGRAQALCKEGLELSRQSGLVHIIAFGLHTSAALAGLRGQLVPSARLWGAAEALRETIGTDFSPMELRVYEPYIGAARAQAEEAAWEAAWQEGRGMSMEEAVEHALSEEPIPAKPPTPEGPHSGLTSREGEVAALVAHGLSNRQIASELSISEYTVANHVAKILRKLGFDSRSQLTAWVVERRTSP